MVFATQTRQSHAIITTKKLKYAFICAVSFRAYNVYMAKPLGFLFLYRCMARSRRAHTKNYKSSG